MISDMFTEFGGVCYKSNMPGDDAVRKKELLNSVVFPKTSFIPWEWLRHVDVLLGHSKIVFTYG